MEPLALSPAAAARFLGVSKRTVYNLIASGAIITRKLPGGRTARTLVDTESLRSYYAALPLKDGGEPLFGEPLPAKPKHKTRHVSNGPVERAEDARGATNRVTSSPA